MSIYEEISRCFPRRWYFYCGPSRIRALSSCVISPQVRPLHADITVTNWEDSTMQEASSEFIRRSNTQATWLRRLVTAFVQSTKLLMETPRQRENIARVVCKYSIGSSHETGKGYEWGDTHFLATMPSV